MRTGHDDGLPYAVAMPRTRSSYWQDRLRMQIWCVKNIGPVELGLWDNNAADGWMAIPQAGGCGPGQHGVVVRMPRTEEIVAFVEGPIENHYGDPDAPYILMESIGGEWIMPGVKLFDGGDFRWGLEGGSEDVGIDIGDLPRQETEYKAAFVRTYPGHAHLMDAPFRLWCLTFYS